VGEVPPSLSHYPHLVITMWSDCCRLRSFQPADRAAGQQTVAAADATEPAGRPGPRDVAAAGAEHPGARGKPHLLNVSFKI
jgi:hypothetical protein